jgi:adenosylhomocysteinase
VEQFRLRNGNSIYLLAEGRLVNLAAAEGHPSEVMDMSFANQALAIEYLTRKKLQPKVHRIPEEIDDRIAELKLKSMNVTIDQLSNRQIAYLETWKEGT